MRINNKTSKNNNRIWTIFGFLALIIVGSQNARADFTFPNPDQLNNDLRNVAIMIQGGDFQSAISYLDKLNNSSPDDPKILALYKVAYNEAKLFPELEKVIRKQLSKTPDDPSLLAELGEARYLQKDETGADSLWNLALEKGKSSEAIYRTVADTKLRYGLYDDAVSIYLRGRKNLGKPDLFSFELAGIYEAQREYGKAVDEYLIQSTDMADKLSFIEIKVRGFIEDSASVDEIVKTINKNIALTPERTELYEILGEIYIKKGQMDEALQCYKTIGSKQKDDGQSLVRFAGRCYDSKAYTTAINAADEYLKTTQKGAFKDMAYLIKAKSQQASGLDNEALANFRTLSSTTPDYRIKDEANLDIGVIYAQKKGECDSALDAWSEALRTVRTAAIQNQERAEMAICYLKKDQTASAESLLTLSATSGLMDDNIERAIFLLGDIAFYKGNLDSAGQIFNGMLAKNPNGAYANDALMRLDVIALVSDDSSKPYITKYADAMKKQVVGEPLQGAAILAGDDFSSTPIAEQALFYSSTFYARGGGNQDAMAGFKKYIEKYPDGLYIDRAYLGLGDIYIQDISTYPDAKAAYNKILESYPNGAVTEQARQKLQMLESAGKIG